MNKSDQKFEKGQPVRLKSGGPIMTIDYYDYGSPYCKWFDSKEQLQSSSFSEESLEAVKKEKDDDSWLSIAV